MRSSGLTSERRGKPKEGPASGGVPPCQGECLRRGTFSPVRESTQRERLRGKMLAGSHFFPLRIPFLRGSNLRSVSGDPSGAGVGMRGAPIRLPPVGAALGRSGGHGLRLGVGFAPPAGVAGLRRPTFSRARESRQRVRIGAAAPMYPKGSNLRSVSGDPSGA